MSLRPGPALSVLGHKGHRLKLPGSCVPGQKTALETCSYPDGWELEKLLRVTSMERSNWGSECHPYVWVSLSSWILGQFDQHGIGGSQALRVLTVRDHAGTRSQQADHLYLG